MKLKSKEKGITLIALVVTIIVLLILAGIAIGLTVGNNGLFSRAGIAKEEWKKAELQEELQMAIDELYIEKAEKSEVLTKKDIAESLSSSKGVVVIEYTEEILDGEYENYQIIIDKDNKVIIGGILKGAKPTAEFIKNPDNQGANVDEIELTVKGKTTEGEIASIESLDGLIAKNDGSNTEKVYSITKNGEYKFKIIGTNGRISIEKIIINYILDESESLLAGIEKITNAGETKIKVKGVTSQGETTEEIYPLNVVFYKGDLTLGQKAMSNGNEVNIENLELKNTNEWTVGNTNDIAQGTEESKMAKNTVVLKVDGNLTIENGYKLTAIGGNYGGPKGMIIYCKNTLTNNGEISMTARGAYAKGQNVYLWKNTDNIYEYVPKNGANGASRAGGYFGWSMNHQQAVGNIGASGIGRSTGGGGSGGVHIYWQSASANYFSGSGSAGTSYSGGSGGGGFCSYTKDNTTQEACDAKVNGGSGGDGTKQAYHNGAPGAGNPVGFARTENSGTGGLLIIWSHFCNGNGNISSNGVNAPTANSNDNSTRRRLRRW